MFTCPHCEKKSISLVSKYLSGKWMIMNCPECGKRSTTHPILLLILYFFYVWDVVLFGYLYMVTNEAHYLVILVVGWLVLDAFSLSLPSARMKDLESKGSS